VKAVASNHVPGYSLVLLIAMAGAESALGQPAKDAEWARVLEIHGKPVKAGDSFSAAHIVGYFDTIEEMHRVYDRYKGHTALSADASGWRLLK
jgi:hypothetical protein